jgi:hypothetical protein
VQPGGHADRRALAGEVPGAGHDPAPRVDDARRADADAGQVARLDARLRADLGECIRQRRHHVLGAARLRRGAASICEDLAAPVQQNRLDLGAAEIETADETAARGTHGAIVPDPAAPSPEPRRGSARHRARGPPDSVAGVVLGVDVGGTKVAVAAVDGVSVRDSI